MTFSIRDLLALIFLFALALLAWRSAEETGRARARARQLDGEIKSLELQLRLDQPALHQEILHTADEQASLAALGERSLKQFETLREKYSALVPREQDVLSLRGVPSLAKDPSPAPVLFRLLVPTQRPVWLKYGVHPAKQSQHTSRNTDKEQDLLRQTPFTLSGPFEMQLPPGDHTLQISVGAAHEGALPIVIALGDTVLLRTSYMSAQVSGAGYSYSSATSQLDFAPSQPLPWLLTASMNLRESATDETHAISLWLGVQASKFTRFPGDSSSQGTP